jgi:hypothetical protein
METMPLCANFGIYRGINDLFGITAIAPVVKRHRD